MVKPGYKQTEIGVIPEDWDVNSIQSVVTSYRTGGNYKNSSEVTELPLIKMGNLSRGYINLHKIEYITRGVSPNPVDRLQYGDVLFNTRNTPELVGKTAVWRNELPCAYYNLNLLRFDFDLERVEPFFFNAILNTKEVMAELKNIAKGTTSVAAIYPQDLMNVKIPIPPISEQRKIAKAMIEMDDLIGLLEGQIVKKKAIKQGAMQELLTGKKRLPGFNEEWVKTKIGSMAEVYSGGTPNTSEPAFWGGKIPWMNSGELNLKIVRQVQGRITKAGMESSSTHFIPAECVLIGLAGQGKTRGTAAFNTFPLCTNQSIAAIYPNPDKFNSKFLYYKMDTQYEQLRELSSGDGGRGGLNKKLILDYEVAIPESIDEQTAIAHILTEMDDEIELLEQKLEKYRQVKQGMMQQLLTGKIRLVD